jgi:hypothetical protein
MVEGTSTRSPRATPAAALIDRPAGSLVTLTVQRGAGPLAISFILAPYL